MKTPETGLTIRDSAKFGKALLEEAVEANREELKKRVISTVQGHLKQLEAVRETTAKLERTQALIESRVKALNAGQFTIERDGKIRFTDEDLNGQVDFISYCGHCGYQKLVIAPIN